MKRTITFIDKIAYALNVLLALLLILACLMSYWTFSSLSAFSVLSLLVPFLFIFNILFLIYWIFRRKKTFLISLITVIAANFVFGQFYLMGENNPLEDTSGLKVMTYNVLGFNKNEWIKKPGVGDSIISFVKTQDPDIICIQEHSRIRYKQLRQYPYRTETPYSVPRTTQAIFSKFKIAGSGSLDLPGTTNNIIYADILYKKDTIRVYNVHLQSFNIVPSTAELSDGAQSEKNFKRLVNTFDKQLEQAKIFKDHIANSPYVNIICGDFNNTQFSNIYKILDEDMTDTFLEKGKGFGRTYNLLGFPIRIDYILADPEFEVLSHQNFNEKLSDHYPVMATLRLTSNQ